MLYFFRPLKKGINSLFPLQSQIWHSNLSPPQIRLRGNSRLHRHSACLPCKETPQDIWILSPCSSACYCPFSLSQLQTDPSKLTRKSFSKQSTPCRCGNDYGWSIFEGSRCQVEQEDRIGTCAGRSRAGYTFPMFEYCHPNYPADPDSVSDLTGGVDVCGARAIEGLAVIVGHPYHGQRFNDVLMDALIFADAQKG